MPDAATDRSPPPAALRVGRLDTAERVRTEAVRLYRAARQGKVPVADASRLTPLLALICRLIEGADFEQRLAALEAQHGNP